MVYVYIASFVGFFASVISMAEISSMCVIPGVFAAVFDDLTHRPVPQPLVANTTGSANLPPRGGSAS